MVIRKANFEQDGTLAIENGDSRRWLAAMGYLGSGQGAAVSRSDAVSFGCRELASAIQSVANRPVQVNIALDGQPYRRLVTTGVDEAFIELGEASIGARG